jgi:hypothetical protein
MAGKKPTIVSNPNAPEIYADRTASVSLRGNIARISLASERSGSDPSNPETVIAGHLAMSVRGFMQLFAQMQSVVQQMEASGMLKAPGAGASKSGEKPAPGRKKASAKAKTASSGGRSRSKKS